MCRAILFAILAVMGSSAMHGQVMADSRPEAISAADEDNCAMEQLARPLAEQGDVNAQLLLGVCYASKKGKSNNIKKYKKESDRWFLLAANQGNADGQLHVGEMYANGVRVKQDYSEAAKWFRLSAEQGNAEAQTYLAQMYKNGNGVPKNLVLAYMWATIAVVSWGENNNPGKQSILKQQIIGIVAHMTDQQIADAEELIKKCVANKLKWC